MADVIERTIKELSELLGYKEKKMEDVMNNLLESIGKETVREIQEGMGLKT